MPSAGSGAAAESHASGLHLTCAYCHLPARLALFRPAQCHSSVLQVKSVTIFRDPRTGISKGCGLVAMASHAEAEAALAALDQKLQVEVLACLERMHTVSWPFRMAAT